MKDDFDAEEESKKCEDIAYFIETYMEVDGKPIVLRDHEKEFLKFIQSANATRQVPRIGLGWYMTHIKDDQDENFSLYQD